MQRVFLFLFLLVIIYARVPTIPPPLNTQVPGPYGWQEAAEIARAEWSRRLDVKLGDFPKITWYEGPCINYEVQIEGLTEFDCLLGAYIMNPKGAEIHLVYEEYPSDSALAHELLHWAIHKKGYYDGDHDRPEWDQLQFVENKLLIDGL